MFQIADIHRMRIYVNVPQAFLHEIQPGLRATLHLPGDNQTTEAQLVSSSNALTESSRTASIELQADNPDGKLWPGAFTEVQFHVPSDPNILRIPTTALVFGSHGMQVATVGDNDRVVLKPVTLGRDIGDHVEVESGLGPSDRLVNNPLESIETGEIVQVASADAKDVPVASKAGTVTQRND